MKILRKAWLKICVWSTRFGLHPKFPKPAGQIEEPFIWRPKIPGEVLSDKEILKFLDSLAECKSARSFAAGIRANDER